VSLLMILQQDNKLLENLKLDNKVYLALHQQLQVKIDYKQQHKVLQNNKQVLEQHNRV